LQVVSFAVEVSSVEFRIAPSRGSRCWFGFWVFT
jgi:hypothetical protein